MTGNKPVVAVYPRESNLPPLIETDGKTQRRNRRKQELRKRKGRGIHKVEDHILHDDRVLVFPKVVYNDENTILFKR